VTGDADARLFVEEARAIAWPGYSGNAAAGEANAQKST
jgi:hypothetical protein